MYVDPLTIYREYVQNAADAIDHARRAGLRAGRIDIRIDAAARSVSIRGRRRGNPQGGLPPRADLGRRQRQARLRRARVPRRPDASPAWPTPDHSPSCPAPPGEDRVSTMTWNIQALRTALRDPADRRDLGSVIAAITTTTVGKPDPGEPFFEVRLEGRGAPGGRQDHVARRRRRLPLAGRAGTARSGVSRARR